MRHPIEALIDARRDQYYTDRPTHEILIMSDGTTVYKGYPPRLCPHGIDLNIRDCEDVNCWILKWDNKVESLAKKAGNQLHGYEQEDLKQEFRIGVFKAAKTYIKDKAGFYTYMLRCCQNAWVSLYRHVNADFRVNRFGKDIYKGVTYEGDDGTGLNEIDIPVMDEGYTNFEVEELINSFNLEEPMKSFLKLRREDNTMDEIKLKLRDMGYRVDVYKLQAKLQAKTRLQFEQWLQDRK